MIVGSLELRRSENINTDARRAEGRRSGEARRKGTTPSAWEGRGGVRRGRPRRSAPAEGPRGGSGIHRDAVERAVAELDDAVRVAVVALAEHELLELAPLLLAVEPEVVLALVEEEQRDEVLVRVLVAVLVPDGRDLL